MKTLIPTLLIVLCTAGPLAAQDDSKRASRGYPPEMPGAREEVYKTVGDTQLKLYIYEPQGHQPDDARAAIVFFFGGGWVSGSPRQFLPHCQYLASRGMVAIAADYRVASRHGVKAVDCVRDAKSAIRYVRQNAKRLGIDPNRIAAGGGSAGGHLAAAAGTLDALDEPGEDLSSSSRPNAMLLFNPAVVLAPVDGNDFGDRRAELRASRAGIELAEISPYHHITKSTPPTVIFHGVADATVPHATVEAFAKAMQDAGNRCTLFSYEGQGHGFFNHGRGGNGMYLATLREADRFLTELGYLQGEPTLDDPPADKSGS